MSEVELRNRDLLQQGLDLVTEPLHEAMASEFSRERGADWLGKLAREKGRRSRVTRDDLASLIDLAFRSWPRFGRRFDDEYQVMRNRLGVLKDERNQNAHGNASDRQADDVLAVLRTVELTLTSLGASTAPVGPLKQECLRRLTGEASPAEPTLRTDADRIEALITEKVGLIARQLEEQVVADPRMDSVLNEVAGLQRSIEVLAASVASPQGNEELTEIRQHLARVERTLEDRTPGFDPHQAADELLAATRQMRDLEQRQQESPSPRGENTALGEPPDYLSAFSGLRSAKKATAKKAAVKKSTAKKAKKAAVKKATRHGARWRSVEDEALLSGWEAGQTVAELASELRRTPSAVASRLRAEHGMNWMLVAAKLPKAGDIVGWQGMASLVDTAQRRKVELATILAAPSGVVGCLVDATGTTTVGPARRVAEDRYEIDNDLVCTSAIDAARQAEQLLGVSSLEAAKVIHVDLQEPAEPPRLPFTPSNRLSNKALADRLRKLGFEPTGPPWTVGKYLRERDAAITKANVQAGLDVLASQRPRPSSYYEAQAVLRRYL